MIKPNIMTTKKTIVLLGAAALLAACDVKDPIYNPPVAASINSAITPMTSGPGSSGSGGIAGMNTTRASGTAWAANDEIGITAIHNADNMKLLDNACYVTRGGDGKFEAEDGSQFYFTDNAEVGFTAYYPRTASEKLTLTVFTDAPMQRPEKQPEIDLLFATATGSAANADVKLQFRHCMSRVVLRFLPGEGIAELDDIEYTLDGMELGGTFNTQTGEAKVNYEMSVNMVHSITLTVPGNGAAELSSPLILFPQQDDTQKTLTLTMRGTTYTATFQLPQNPQSGNVRELLAGHSYTYNVKINNTTMTISQATINPWEDGGSEDIESTN